MKVLLAFTWPVSETVVERLGWVLVHSLWQFAFVALLAGVTVQALRRRSAATRYGVLVVALALLVAAPVATWIILPVAAPDHSAGLGTHAPGQASNAATSSGADASPLPGHSSLAGHSERGFPALDPAGSRVASEMGPEGSAPTPAMMQPAPSWSQRTTAFLRPWLVWMVAGWSLGVVLCSLRPLLGCYMLRRLQRVGLSPVSDEVVATLQRVSDRFGLRRAVPVLQSTLARVPVVVGYLRPVILLPVRLVTSIPTAQLETILAHELAHVRRHDFVINLLQTLVETLFFYHPAVWWLSREIRIEREHCCDDFVVLVLGNRVEYGRALVAVEELRGQNTVLALGATDGALLSRVRRIVGVGSDHNALSLVGRWPAALLGLLLIGVIGMLTTNWRVAAEDDTEKNGEPARLGVRNADGSDPSPSDERAANDQPGDNNFGPESNGLRCRLVAVPTTADDTSPDLTKPANAFARGDDVTFVVELKNVSDKLVTLLGVRHHTPRQPAFDGKLASEFFAPHLFEFDFADATGAPVPRPKRVFFGMNFLLSGASAHEIAPAQALMVVLRPARFNAPMDYRLPPGTYRAKVRYRGPSDSTWTQFREHSPGSPQAKAWAKEVTSNEVTFTVARDPSAPRPAKLAWGEVKDGLQAAVEFRSPPGAAATTDPPGTLPAKPYVSTIFHVKNVSDRTLTFVSETGRQGDEVTATNEAGETQRLEGAFFSGWPIVVRWTLKPGEVAQLHALTAGIGLLDKPGKYTLRYHINFANLVQNKGEGEFGFPRKEDWQQVLVTGDTPVTIRARTAEDDAREQPARTPEAGSTPKRPGDAKADAIAPNGEIVGRLLDAATGKPVAGATVACGAIINDSGMGGGANAVTNADGSYRLVVPSPGIYNVWLKKFDKDPTLTAAADDGILVEAGKVAASGLHLVVGRKVTGKVVDADGKPFANLKVSCHSPASPESGGVQSATTKAEGTFEFFLPPGRAYVYAYEPVAQTKDNPFGVGRSAHAHFQVSATEDVVPITLTLQLSGSKFGDPMWLDRSTPGTQIVRREGNQNVTGTVVDVSGKPIAGAKVFPEDGPLVATNDKGEFRVETMKGTQFVMHAFAAGYHIWFGTPTSGDVLKIVLERKTQPGAKPGPREPVPKPTEVAPDGKQPAEERQGRNTPPVNPSDRPLNPLDPVVQSKLSAAGVAPVPPEMERWLAPYRNLRDEDVEKFVLDTVRTPFDPDPAKGSWQDGAYEAQVLGSLSMVRQQDRLVKTLLKVVDRTEKAEPDQRRLAMIYLGGAAPRQVLPLLLKDLEAAARTPTVRFVPFHEIAVLGQIGEEARDAVPVLFELLDFPDGLVRGEAIEALVKIGPSSTEVMNALAKRFDDPRAVYQAGRYGELAKPLGPTFVKLLDSKSRPIRTWAAGALVKSGYDEARGFEVLLREVAAGTPENRSDAATALAALGSQASSMISRLRAYENDANEQVAKAVRDAIRRIEKNDRIFTHAEEAAKTAAARKAGAEAATRLRAASEPPMKH